MQDFQRSAFWNLRASIANVCIVVGFFAAFAVVVGGATGWRLAPSVVAALAVLPGLGVYLTRERPALLKWPLIAAVLLAVLGVLGLIIAVQVFNQ